jgi:hypothetical protein
LQRLVLLRRLGRDLPSVSARFGNLVEGLPFRLGEGPRDWVLPVAWDDEIDGATTGAIDQLCELIASRRQPGQAAAKAARYGVRRGLPKLGARMVATAAELDPQLDPALTVAWWDSIAGKLGAALQRAFRRALEVEVGSGTRPPLAFLAALAAAWLPARVKNQALRGLTYERLEKAVGFALFSLAESAAELAIEEVSARPGPVDPGPSSDRLRLALNPLAFCSIRTKALQNDLNPWGLGEKLSELWDSRLGRVTEVTGAWEQAEHDLLERALSDPNLREEVERVGRRSRLREVLLPLLLEGDRGADEAWSAIRAALGSDEALEAFRLDVRGSTALLGQAGGTKAQAQIQPLLGAAMTLEDGQRGATCLLCWRADRLLVEALDRAHRSVRDERLTATPAELGELYERGRLYRLSGDGKPLLQTALTRSTGFLFVDLKGFTQRTVRSKEIAVADFLRREFYEPILVAARELVPKSNGDLHLLNLVGDAAAFSGDIAALVQLSAEIRTICADYEKKLEGLAPTARRPDYEGERLAIEQRQGLAEERLLLERTLLEGELARKASLTAEQRWAELERQIGTRNSQLAQAFQDVTDRLKASPAAERPAIQLEMKQISEAQDKLVSGARTALEHLDGLDAAEKDIALHELFTGREQSRMAELDAALEQLRAELAQQLAVLTKAANAGGSGLVAGVFISFGTASEEIRIADPVFGEVKVSVAERLNEAARGTGRSSKVLAEVEEGARAAAFKRGNAAQKTPFFVHLDAPEAGKASGEIYNGGQALSGEALDVFLRTTVGPRFHFQRNIALGDLAAEIGAKLHLPDHWSLILSLPSAGEISEVLAFRRVGRVVFRGFEEAGGCDVYELLPADGALMRLLLRNHVAHWVQEAKSAPGQLLTQLPRAEPPA